jgi:hypothetical protein
MSRYLDSARCPRQFQHDKIDTVNPSIELIKIDGRFQLKQWGKEKINIEDLLL